MSSATKGKPKQGLKNSTSQKRQEVPPKSEAKAYQPVNELHQIETHTLKALLLK
ncbi:MAG: hypothetical protein V6Z82_03380 [Flavobacteriales bacterium]